MAPQFIFFDLGNVLVNFDHARGARQLSEVCGIPAERVRQLVFPVAGAIGPNEPNLGLDYEKGRVSTAEFCQRFRELTETDVDDEVMCEAVSDIFQINPAIIPLVAALRNSHLPLGILSNTCEAHWNWLERQRYALLDLLPLHALSFRLGSVKPEADIFRRAAELAGCQPSRIFFTDDLPANVEAARGAGFDAVLYTGVAGLVKDLRERDVEFRY